MKKILAIFSVLIIGFILAFSILKTEKVVSVSSEEHETGEHTEAEGEKGSHGGKLLSKDNFSVEITIFEKGVPPEFRVYAYENAKPINLNDVSLNIELERIQSKNIINFKKQNDYLLGDKVIEEPHSFDVNVNAKWQGKDYSWKYGSYEGRTELNEDMIKKSDIKIERAGQVYFENNIDLPGEIVLNADRVAHVVPQLQGVVTSVSKNLGDIVRKGDVLATINSRELADAKREYIESIHHLELVKAAFDREDKLWKKKITSEEEYFTKRHAYEEGKINNYVAGQKLTTLGLAKSEISSLELKPNQDLSSYKIFSPFSGTVIEKHISIGEAIKSDSDIFKIADLSSLWVEITVSPKDVHLIKKGAKILLKSSSINKQVTGKLVFVSSIIVENTRKAKAFALIDNSSGVWSPGLFITATIPKEKQMVKVAVRKSAIQTFRDWDVVFVRSGNVFQAQPIETGSKTDEWVEVLSGISSGTQYVSKNSFIIKADIEKSGASHDH